MFHGILSGQQRGAAPPVGRVFNIGTGSGTLTINGTGAGTPWHPLQDGDKFILKGGTYTALNWQNMDLASGTITVENEAGQDVITNSWVETGVHRNVTYNFYEGGVKRITCRMTGQECFHIDRNGDGGYKNVHWLGFQYVTHTGYAGGGVFIDHARGNAIPYNNGAGVIALENCGFEHIKFSTPTTNKGVYYLMRIGQELGDFADGKFSRGFYIKDIELDGYMELENAVYLENAEAYYIQGAHGTGVNQNLTNPPHFRLFLLGGQGIFEQANFRNYSGNVVAMWPYSRLDNNSPCIIRNSMSFDSRVYSFAEYQPYARNVVAGVSKTPDVKILGVTTDTLDTAKQYSGCVADIYNLLGASAEVVNCVNINGHNEASGGAVVSNNSVIRNMSGTTIDTSSCRIYSSRGAAGVIAGNYKLTETSPLLEAGVTHPDLVYDYYGNLRGPNPSIGASQVVGEAPAIVSISISPSAFEINEGQTQQLVATATYDDSTTEDVTAFATWASSATGTATVNSSGLVTGVAEGVANVTATIGSVSGTSVATIEEAPIVSANWTMGINFCSQYSSQAGGNWNNAQRGVPATLANLKSMDGTNRGLSVAIAGGFGSADNSTSAASLPISELYESMWYGGSWEQPGQITLSGFNASKVYKIKVIVNVEDYPTGVYTSNNSAAAITGTSYPTSADLNSDTGYIVFTLTGSTAHNLYFWDRANGYYTLVGAVIEEYDA